MARNITVDRITRFKGINQRTPINLIGPNEALDCRNVVCNNSGFLEKLRVPTTLALGPAGAPGPFTSGPSTIAYYTKSSPATKQYIANYGNSLYSFDATTLIPTLIETSATDAPTWNWVEANNILFGGNGQRAAKWIGNALQNWGGAGPAAAPIRSWTVAVTLTRAANVVSAVFASPVDLKPANDFVQISNCQDASFNGSFLIATFTDQTHYTWAQTAPDQAVSKTATATSGIQTPSFVIGANQAVRAGGITTITVTASSGTTPSLGADFVASARGLQVLITGVADASFNGVFAVVSKQGNVIVLAQSSLADSTSGGGTLGSNFTTAFGRAWAYSWKNSLTKHETSRSPATGSIGGAGGRPLAAYLNALAPTDPQFDTIVWYETLDGGGDFFKALEVPVSAGLQYIDVLNDSQLDTTTVASLINGPPPSDTKYIAKYQGRIFGAGMVSAPQDIWYTGYEQILVGRPEESVPPNNRLRLAIGADDVRAIGVIQAGVIAFSKSDKMYMLRGIIEDITISAPVQFTAYLEELPWAFGAFSHYSVVSTEYGLIWFSSDKTVRIYDGYGLPSQISPNIWPILKSVTPGQEPNARGAFISWLDRQWYALCLAVNGSAVNNLILLFDLLPDQEQNAGVFVFDIGQVDSIASLEDANGQRILIIGQGGNLKQIRTASVAVNGLSQGISTTASTLYAYWRGGYHGNENAEVNKMYRWGRVISDQPTGSSSAFIVTARLVDQERRPFTSPEIKAALQPAGEKYVINRKAKRCSTEIDFPIIDVDINVLEMELAYIPTGVR